MRVTSLKPFQKLARLCARKGIKNVVISPGSRNAVLTIAFVNEKQLNCYSISDERSAAYIALGMALQTGKPTAIICTSGTATLNYAPAIAEAYFQEIPLLVLTADRPPEWVHQYDGQTIFQENIYGKHVKKSFQWSPDQKDEHLLKAESISKEAIDLSVASPKGPVHINIPIREPFYPKKVENLMEEWEVDNLTEQSPEVGEDRRQEFLGLVAKSNKRLLVVGQQHEPKVTELAHMFAVKFGFALVADTISNVSNAIQNHDHFLQNSNVADLAPDFLISLDKSLISKSLKLMLRNNEIENHWHIQHNPAFIDPFLSLKRKVEMPAEDFLEQMLEITGRALPQNEYQKTWNSQELESKAKSNLHLKKETFSEFHILKKILTKLPKGSILHSGNSMSIRYINALQSYLRESIVFCNRGTSGIDGSLSTAVGQAMVTDKAVYCVLGDVSFQYDKNALWNRYLPDNLKIIVLNNAGGIIFSMIDGPSHQDSFEDFFKTQQPNKADLIAEEFGLVYFSIGKQSQVDSSIQAFLDTKCACILEIFTDTKVNKIAFNDFFN